MTTADYRRSIARFAAALLLTIPAWTLVLLYQTWWSYALLVLSAAIFLAMTWHGLHTAYEASRQPRREP